MSRMVERVFANRLYKYLILSLGITWTLWLGEAVLLKVTAQEVKDSMPRVLFTLGGFGPTIAACLCLKDGFLC